MAVNSSVPDLTLTADPLPCNNYSDSSRTEQNQVQDFSCNA